MSTATPVIINSKKPFPTPSFVSPEPAAAASTAQMQRTLSAGLKKKKQKRKLDSELQRAAGGETPATGASGLARKKHKLSAPASRLTPQQQLQQLKLTMKLAAAAITEKKPLLDISNGRAADASAVSNPRRSDVPTRKLDFAPTPDKAARKQPPPLRTRADEPTAVGGASSDSASSSDDSDASSDSGYSSDEAEVAFDAVTLGNTRIVREAESPLSSAASAASAASSSSRRPVGLEYRFSVSSTVSSIAVAPNGQFLVVGFYNGTIYLYPLSKDSLRFRGGVLLDHITARGMYTQLMVRVAIPEDGRFIFAGVYRGSTEIRAFEVDSIQFPPAAAASSAGGAARTSTRYSDDDDDDDDDGESASHARAVTHTFSDPKLKGFGAVTSVFRPTTRATEYRLLCGLGIKNVHLWRFFRQPATGKWNWECVFDKQANGISLEFLGFDPRDADRIVSKSEHQNIRVWTLAEQRHDDDFASVTLTKAAHVDVKNSADTTAVFGDVAYGGAEALALIDLRSASRTELDLPLSVKEQQAQLAAAAASHTSSSARITASMRQRNSRRRGVGGGPAGAEELGGVRHMRTVSQVAGRAGAPFTVGMCSDGSVFVHQPRRELGLATPLEFVDGYERFFQDPSLSFQAQFSDLTRVNTSGLLAVLPLPATTTTTDQDEGWMVVAANQDQLLVRSLKAFLCRNQQVDEREGTVKRGLRELGGAASSASSSSSDSDSSSDSEGELAIVLDGNRHVMRPVSKPTAQDVALAAASKPKEKKDAKSKPQLPAAGHDRKRAKSDSTDMKAAKPVVLSVDVKAAAESMSALKELAPCSLDLLSEQATRSSPLASVPLVVTTPTRAASDRHPVTPYHSVASPVVSVTSLSSGASNPNTPEAHAKLSQRAKQLLVLKDLEWTPPPKAAVSAKNPPREDNLAAALSAKPTSSRSKTLFSDAVGDDDDDAVTAATSSNKAAKKATAAGKASKLAKTLESGVATGKKALSVAARAATASSTKRADDSQSPVEATEAAVSIVVHDDVDMAACDDETDDDDELETLEEEEPEFVTTPLLSDGSSLLSASLFQFRAVDQSIDASAADAVGAATAENDALVLDEQATLLLQFAEQNERLQRNFYVEKERIYQQLDCPCSVPKKKSGHVAADSTGGAAKPNWKKTLSGDFAKRKQLKRRQKKQLALKLRHLHGNYRAQIRELLAVQKLQASALTARQQFKRLYQQLRRQDESGDAATPSAAPGVTLPAAAAAPAPSSPVVAEHATVTPSPPLSISFPYLSLLASLSSS
ncbi:hypothetical protein PybrP1_000970 [[Pythium] brassicae (nom. inval.)]|nr:hypothetical protein PybrP1_000970 [[Pythium] brassicae (nom. inval.)]